MVRVWACPNSQHSKWKVIDFINPNFPKLSDYISVLYGNYFDAPLDTNLTKFDNLSLMDLYNMTQPEMVVLRVKPSINETRKFRVETFIQCHFNMRDCPLEKLELTRFGWCHYYSFDRDEMVTIAGPHSSLTFYAVQVYNSSSTFACFFKHVRKLTSSV